LQSLDDAHDAVVVANHIIAALETEAQEVLIALLAETPGAPRGINEQRARFGSNYDRLVRRPRDDAGEKAYAELLRGTFAFRALGDQLLSSAQSNRVADSVLQLTQLLRQAVADAEVLRDAELSLMRRLRRDVRESDRLKTNILASVMMALIGGAALLLRKPGRRQGGGHKVGFDALPNALSSSGSAAEAELRRTKERLELAVRSSNQCIWEYEMPDGRMDTSRATYVNVWESLRHDPENVTTDVGEIMRAAVHPDDLAKVHAALDRFLNSKERDYELESRVVAKDGSVIWHLSRGVALRDGSGRAIRFIGTSIDITALKRAEEALRASEQRFRVFADHATDAFFLHDEQFIIRDVNKQACDCLGYTRDELLGMALTAIDPDIDTTDLPSMQQQLLDGQMLAFESRHRRKDGSTFHVEVHGQLFREGERCFTLALARDTTERMQVGQVT